MIADGSRGRVERSELARAARRCKRGWRGQAPLLRHVGHDLSAVGEVERRVDAEVRAGRVALCSASGDLSALVVRHVMASPRSGRASNGHCFVSTMTSVALLNQGVKSVSDVASAE